MSNVERDTIWKRSETHVFWGEIAPCEHVVQIYDNEEAFLKLLTGFVMEGILHDECVILIVTEAHMEAIQQRLHENNFNTFELKLADRLIILSAKDTLDKFMVDGWPDQVLFNYVISGLIARAKSKKRRVRACGEMVALLWSQGNNGATVQLEHLWNQLMESEKFTLFCAYPKSGFTQDAEVSLKNICRTHSKVIDVRNHSESEVLFKLVE